MSIVRSIARKRSLFAISPFAISIAFSLTAVADETVLKEVVVSGTRLRDQVQTDVPASVTVLSERTLTDSAQQHFEEVLTQIPNLNWAAGTSRPRYFQIRGIGEREQYEGAPNSSVGFLIDDIDFSGVGMAATLFDVDQVEVMRGPQGTRLGANALAGLIAVHSADPADIYDSRVIGDVGNYDTRSLGVSATGPVESLDSAWRLSAQKYRSDGFRTNTYLHRDDTNGRDELTVRGKWRAQTGDHGQLDIAWMHVDLANGYDAFSIDNSRVTLSDKPGEDSQRANAASVKWNNEFSSGLTLTALATALDSTAVNSFDADWGNPQSWAPYSDFDYYYRADRDHKTQTLEVRLASPALSADRPLAWLAGIYALRLRERLLETTNYSDPLQSDYDATNSAVFGQVEGRLAPRWSWAAGLRAEMRNADYEDTRPTDASRTDHMAGGHASLTYDLAEKARAYASVARGYKAGGFNLGTSGLTRPEFEPESLWNYEAGVKAHAFDNRLYVESSVFYMRRQDMQVRSGEQSDPSNPASYVFVTSNVSSGYNYGMESSIRWLPAPRVELGAALGLLRTQESGARRSDGTLVASREQAHAPNYQLHLDATYRDPRGPMLRVDFAAVDSFFFDVPTDHNQKSKPYTLTNIKAGYESGHWSVMGWVRNVFDQQYATRGFYFANDPVDTQPKLYIQNGDPRQVGVSVEWVLR